jgi:hypothetical protein
MRLSMAVAAVLITTVGGARCGGLEKLPRVSITLPEGVSADGVQVRSFLSGPFGGYGGFAFKPHGQSYDIDAFVEEIAAERFQAIAYMPGCELSLFDIPMHSVNVTRRLECRRVVQVPMSGKVAQDEGRRASSLEVKIQYEARWAHRFFDIKDGPGTTFEVTTIPIQEDGSFSVSLPELNQDPAERMEDETDHGSFVFMLREKKTWNIVGTMAPTELRRGAIGLELRSWYPAELRFTLEK